MKKTLLAVALSLTGAAVAQSPAGGGVSSRNVHPELRTERIQIGPGIDIQDEGDTSVGVAAQAAAGEAGVVYKFTAATTFDATTSIAVPVIPSRLYVFYIDGGAADTSVCSINLFGFNQFGSPIKETVSMTASNELNGTTRVGVYTNNAFEKVSRVQGTCSTAGATNTVIITSTFKIGLPMRVSGQDAVKNICLTEVDSHSSVNNNMMVCWAPSTAEAATTFDKSRVNVTYSTLDLETGFDDENPTASTTATITRARAAVFTFRAPNGAK